VSLVREPAYKFEADRVFFLSFCLVVVELTFVVIILHSQNG